jgi:predicted nucleic-acid-binding Zn-ribbon protein
MKRELKIEYFGTVEKLQDRTDLSLATDSQDIEAVKDFLAGSDKRTKLRKEIADYSLFFVNCKNGEYSEFYASINNTAYLNAHLDKIEIVDLP